MPAGHGAAGSALGYYYQATWALLELLRRGPDIPDARISIELYDDVAWDAAGTAMERLQLKHHLNAAASITDKGADLWRTIGVWMDEGSPGDPTGELLALVTTAVAPADSGVYRLRPPTRDASEALRLIEKAAQESAAQDTAGNRGRFLGLSETDRQTLILRMHVLDGQPHAVDIDDAVRKQLMWAMPRGRDDLFMEMLWGWWSGEVLAALSGRRGSSALARFRIASQRLGTSLQRIGFPRCCTCQTSTAPSLLSCLVIGRSLLSCVSSTGPRTTSNGR